MYKSILVCLDGSEFAEQALEVATPLCRQWEARLTLCRGVPPRAVPSLGPLPGQFAEDALNAAVARAHTYLESLASQLPEDIEHHVVAKAGSLIEILKELIPECGIELIIMATHHHHGFRRWLAGSTTEKLLREARCPLLALPFDGPA